MTPSSSWSFSQLFVLEDLVVNQATQLSPTLMNSLEWCCREICRLQAEQGPDKANAILRVLVARTPSAVALMDLCGKHFLPLSSNLPEGPLELNMLKARLRSDVLDDLERAGQYFEVLQSTSKYHASLAVFLHLLLALVEGLTLIKDALSCLTVLQYEAEKLGRLYNGSHNIFDGTGFVTKEIASRIVSSLEK
jgi:hypothetical protein